jgi:hypothetical protein
MSTLTSFSNQPLERAQFLRLLETALSVNEFAYARLLALAWLTTFPGDLGVSLRHAQALVGLKLQRQAIPVLEAICQADPEFLEAQQLLAECGGLLQLAVAEEAQASLVALSPQPTRQAGGAHTKWGRLLRQAKSFQAQSTRLQAKGGEEQGTADAETLGSEYSRLVHAALLENPSSPLAALAHLYFMRRNYEQGEVVADAVTSLARAYHVRWPRCLAFSLILADRLMEDGAGEEAVALLHQVAARDVTAQVATRIWGADHPYRSLWPDQLVIEPSDPARDSGSAWAVPVAAPQGLPVPAPVAAVLGWNQLATTTLHPTPAAATPVSKTGAEGGAPGSKARTATRPRPHSGQSTAPASRPADFPIYVIFSDRQALQRVYGAAAARRIEAAARRLVRAIGSRPDWDAMLYFPPERTAPYTPWDLKLALADLDDTLAGRGERIGALLILGGPEIVPFHLLPNPVDDSDEAVPSDNPYATRDENYFVAEWPVGRLPGGHGKDPSLLLENLQRYTDFHTHGPANTNEQRPWLRRWLDNLARLILPPAWPILPAARAASSYGYTAAVWQRASLSVFRPIGTGGRLKISPPLAINELGPADQPQLNLPAARMAYFNLHGQRESAVWYGQSDPTASASGATLSKNGKKAKKAAGDGASQAENRTAHPLANPDFPVALRPVDILAGAGRDNRRSWLPWHRPTHKTPGTVFSEACYGAYIDGRSSEQAISLTFLRAGASSFVGSTCIAYGAISMPLSAADLLGHAFWQFLMDGHPAGEALRRAKVFLSAEMDRRQGYLDGEDQKTLVSFVLYGDPLYSDPQVRTNRMKFHMAKHKLNLEAGSQALPEWLTHGLDPEPQSVPTVCDRVDSGTGETNLAQASAGNSAGISPEVLAHVRQIVSKYLPGMSDASMTLAIERAACQVHGHTCPTAQLNAKSAPEEATHADRRVVTLSKSITRPFSDPKEGKAGAGSITHQQYARLTLDANSKLVKLVVSR